MYYLYQVTQNMYIYYVISTQLFNSFRYLRSVAYRQYIQLVYGFLGKRRIPLPPCAYNAIWSKFERKEFEGYDEDEQ